MQNKQINSIELSDICLVFLTEFIKQHKKAFEVTSGQRLKFLKMNANQRRALIEKTIDRFIPS